MINNSTYDNKMNNLHNSSNKQKTTTYDVGNPGPDLGHAQKCGRVKPGSEISNLPSG
jgi:hypothetical protein